MTTKLTTTIKYTVVFLVTSITHWLLFEHPAIWKSLLFGAVISLIIILIKKIQHLKNTRKEPGAKAS